MRKSEVQKHSDRIHGPQYPAINVKCRQWVKADEIISKFKCSEAQAVRASEYAYHSSVQQFWEQAQELAKEMLGPAALSYGAGRSNGWLIVTGLHDLEYWDAIMLGKWSRFMKVLKDDIEYRCKSETILEDIEANQWYKEGAEEFNFIDTKEGMKCIADLKAQANAAGFGAVVRAPVPA